MIKIARESVKTPKILLSKKTQQAFADAQKFFAIKFEKRIQRSYTFEKEIFFHPDVKDTLEQLFHDKCAYCESPLHGMGVLDHFRPRAGALGLDGSLDPDHYWWLAYQWENFYLCCEKCNFNKGNKFPVDGKRASLETMPPDIYKVERSLLIDPCHDDPDKSLLFTDDGMVIGQDRRGKVTAEILDLNRGDLVEGRRRALDNLASVLKLFEKSGITSQLQNTIKVTLEPATPFQGASKQFIGRWLSKLSRVARPDVEKLQIFQRTYKVDSRYTDIIQSFIDSSPSTASMKSSVRQYKEEQREQETSHERVTFGPSNYIQRIEIRNFRVIKDLSLDFPDPRQDYIPWIILLGENGVGKSSVLKAVALALMDEDDYVRLNLDASKIVRFGTRSGHVRVFVSGYSQPFEVYFRRNDSRFYKEKPDGRKRHRGKYNKLQASVFGYGGTRLLPLPKHSRPVFPGLARVDNLFNPFIPLVDARAWLLSLEGEDGNERFGYSARAIKKLLLRQDEDTLIRSRDRVALKIPAFGTTIPLEELSDGYQSTVALATDIMSVALKDWQTAEFAEGIVLLDEIDVHLHPSWKMEIVKGLREVFPRMQFLITTHDPLCLLGTRPGEIHVLNRDLETHQIRPTQVDLPPGITPDQMLTGFWFGLTSTYDADTRQLLEQHRHLLRKGTPEDDPTRLELESELRKRLGTFADTSIDRMAQSVAAQVLTEEHRTISPKERKEIHDKLLSMVRQQRAKKEG